GGGQNTIINTADNAPFPIGTAALGTPGGVLTGVAKPGSCPTATGELALATGSLTAPSTPGDYTLQLSDLFANVIKAGQTGTPFWATEAAGAGTITNLTIHVGSSQIHLVSADPLAGHSLWRSAKNIVRLRFDGVINALPTASDILIREMTGTSPNACGTFAASLTSGNFTFALGGICAGGANVGKMCGHNAECPGSTCTIDNMTLTIQETATTLVHRKWYEVSSAGWSNVAAFGGGPTVAGTPNAQFVLQVGDVNDDGKVQTNDAGAVYPKVPCVTNCGDNRREDVNGDQKIQTNDAGTVYPHVPSLNVAKPCGH
ncbi:MAG: hypothetical protein HYR83_05345, partial [Planctomycetes bacterium]|nr:hypothetical protein [Planctomycetota bacterium]